MPARPPRSTIPLNGSWSIAPGDPTAPANFTRTIPVPGLVDLANPGYDWTAALYHWYKKTFAIQSSNDYSHTRLVIEQSMFGTAVWVNGAFVGEDIACYTSQDFDVSPFIRKGENELLVRIGHRASLPPHSAVGHDQERKAFIPGIWGDVRLERSGIPFIRVVQVIPDLDRRIAGVRVTLHNPSDQSVRVAARVTVSEWQSGLVSGTGALAEIEIHSKTERTMRIDVPLSTVGLWWPEEPRLYQANVEVHREGATVDTATARFGLREFMVRAGDFLLNGRKILLRGGNIAFHRFLSDDQRGSLPWDPVWMRRVLIDIPKEHNFNFFRAHIGQMYNRWYDVADEAGMLIQNEWQFWTTSGSKEQIIKEFTRWIEDNANHPSIVIWDPLNESTDKVLQHEIVPLMKQLDPTRPWESVDFTEEHPYIYSLGPVLNDRKFGFSRALQDIEASERPSVINEFLWWWIDRNGNPSSLMDGIVERWIGPKWTKGELLAYQGFLATELIELFRRMGVGAIQPFVYLSNNNGPTAHWFLGNIRDLQPKPILAALKNAFSPIGVSVEMWDRHFFAGEKRSPRVFVFNDMREPFSGFLEWGVTDSEGQECSSATAEVNVDSVSSDISGREFLIPDTEGPVTLFARVLNNDRQNISLSQKKGYVLREPSSPGGGIVVGCFAMERESEVRRFLTRLNIRCLNAEPALNIVGSIVVAEGGLHSLAKSSLQVAVREFVTQGGTLILLEPEFEVEGRKEVELFSDCRLTIVHREDADRGGYDSVVTPSKIEHPVWRGIEADHLRFLNGAFGGEMVSQHDVVVSREFVTHARCGISLKTPALMEVPYGHGRVIISRIQVRGRLEKGSDEGLYARRPDPVAQKYLLNLLTAFSPR